MRVKNLIKPLSRKTKHKGEERQFDLRTFSLGTWNYDTVNRKLTGSQDVYKILGTDHKHLSNPQDIFLQNALPTERSMLNECFERAFHGEMIGSIIFKISHNQRTRFIYCQIQNKYDANGELFSVSGTVRDITNILTQQEYFFEVKSENLVAPEHVASMDIDRHLKIVRVNQEAVNLFGWSEEELLLKELPNIPTRYEETQRRIFKTILQYGGVVRFDTVRIKKNGVAVNVGVTLGSVRSETGDIIGIRGTYTDVVENNDGRKLLLEIEQQIMAIVKNSADACMILSKDTALKYISPAITNVLGYSPDEFAKIAPNTLLHPEDMNAYTGLMKELLAHPKKTRGLELRLKHKNGEWRYCSSRIRYLSGYYGIDGFIINFHDITEYKQNQQLLQYMSNFDALTDLPNRRLYYERLHAMLGLQKQRGGKLALIRLDINQFHYIKDTLGRSAGDDLMKYVAEELRRLISKASTLFRVGENEFAITVPDVRHKNDAIEFAGQIIGVFKVPFTLHDRDLYPTCNLGLSLFPDDGTETEMLIKNTDVALRYARKELGPNTLYLYSAKLNAKAYKAFALANDFRNALKDDEFVLHYQPRIDIVTGRVVAAEALIRWEHKEWGLVAPKEFLHLAEETSLIVTLGDWVLRKVCSQIVQWRTQLGNSVPVSVNFAVKQLLSENIVAKVRDIMDEFDIEPNEIEIEITETSILPNDPRIVAAIKEFRDMGIRIFFDDFGTGYSSLSWLYQFELDGLKLDRVFINQIPDHPVSTEIVTSVIKMAQSLNLTVVGEGVETRRQLEFLSTLGCDQIQGFLFSRPVHATEFARILREGIRPTEEKTWSFGTETNRRKYFRVYPDKPLLGEFTVVKLKSKRVNIGYSPILITDIGPGGLRFVSDLQLPSKHDFLASFRVKILGDPLELTGQIVWKEDHEDELFQYGVELIADEVYRERLLRIFNNVLLKTRNGTMSYDKDEFYTRGIHSFFKNEND